MKSLYPSLKVIGCDGLLNKHSITLISYHVNGSSLTRIVSRETSKISTMCEPVTESLHYVVAVDDDEMQ